MVAFNLETYFIIIEYISLFLRTLQSLISQYDRQTGEADLTPYVEYILKNSFTMKKNKIEPSCRSNGE